MCLLLLPKFLGALHWRRVGVGLRAFGGAGHVLLSMLVEIVFSMLLTPILMVFYTKFVLSSLTGVAVKWGQQQRNEERPGWRQLAGLLGGQTLGGVLGCLLVAWLAPELLPWLLPVLVGLIAAIPFARVTSSTELGERARKHGWFLIPEETAPPPELQGLDARLLGRESPFFEQPEYAGNYGLLQAVLNRTSMPFTSPCCACENRSMNGRAITPRNFAPSSWLAVPTH